MPRLRGDGPECPWCDNSMPMRHRLGDGRSVLECSSGHYLTVDDDGPFFEADE